jgi:hypothetical protein
MLTFPVYKCKQNDFAFQIHRAVLTHHVLGVKAVRVEKALVTMRQKYPHSPHLLFHPNLQLDYLITAVWQDSLGRNRK